MNLFHSNKSASSRQIGTQATGRAEEKNTQLGRGDPTEALTGPYPEWKAGRDEWMF